jgi:hypothetical protein
VGEQVAPDRTSVETVRTRRRGIGWRQRRPSVSNAQYRVRAGIPSKLRSQFSVAARGCDGIGCPGVWVCVVDSPTLSRSPTRGYVYEPSASFCRMVSSSNALRLP